MTQIHQRCRSKTHTLDTLPSALQPMPDKVHGDSPMAAFQPSAVAQGAVRSMEISLGVSQATATNSSDRATTLEFIAVNLCQHTSTRRFMAVRGAFAVLWKARS